MIHVYKQRCWTLTLWFFTVLVFASIHRSADVQEDRSFTQWLKLITPPSRAGRMGDSELMIGGIDALLSKIVQADKSRNAGYMVKRLNVNARADMERIVKNAYDSGCDIWAMNGSQLTMRVDAVQWKNFSRQVSDLISVGAIFHRTIVNDIDELLKLYKSRERKQPSRWKRSTYGDEGDLEAMISQDFISFKQFQLWIKAVSDHPKYSHFVKLQRIGLTFFRNPLIVVEISHKQGRRMHNKQLIWIDSGIHAREWISSASMLYFIWNMLHRRVHNDTRVIRLLNKYVFTIMPYVNPDGYELSFKGRDTAARFWRKNVRPIHGSDCFGVDLNRNYPYVWNYPGGASRDPCSEVFNGYGPASEAEIQAITSFILTRTMPVRAFFTFHSYGQYWFYPWGYTVDEEINDRDEMHNRARLAVRAMTTKEFRNWTVGQSSKIMYISTGTAEDWARSQANIKYTYCIELPPSDDAIDGFVVSATKIRPVGRIIFKGLRAFMESLTKKRPRYRNSTLA